MNLYQARNVEIGNIQDHQLNNPHLPRLFPTEYHSPLAMGLGDPAFLAAGVGLTGDAIWGLNSDQRIETFETYTTLGEIDTGWPTNDTAKLRGDIGANNIFFISNSNSQDDLISRDIGTANISETVWIDEWEWDLTTFTQHTTGGNAHKAEMGLVANLNTGDVPNADIIGIQILNDQTTGNLRILGLVRNGTSSTTVEMFTDATPIGPYFFRVLRSAAGACAMSVFSDEARTVQLGSTVNPTVTSATQLLRYQFYHIFTQSTNGVTTGTMVDFQFRNNFTSF